MGNKAANGRAKWQFATGFGRSARGSWTVLVHPPYSPDLAPTDYHSFSDKQRSHEGTDFKTISDVENCLVSYFASKKPEFLRTGTMSLQNRWKNVVNNETKYY
uniref:Histone-lysine N-methyltransferase SETMAR n=1 Tax=Caenorhabditis japonica TaxID=281687 RepID=A0A8R1IK49_CAEJA